MKTISWTTLDRSEWGSGPWDSEPDKIQWEDISTGLPCLAVRNHFGQWCGYVGISPGHPFYGVHYSNCANRPTICPNDYCSHSPSNILDVHGGITFTSKCSTEYEEEKGICHIPEEGEEKEVWWLGFDCAHWNDESPSIRCIGNYQIYRTLKYVQGECSKLALQLDNRDLEEEIRSY